jgi:heat shock protein HslJ/uncharacterized membrane protein
MKRHWLFIALVAACTPAAEKKNQETISVKKMMGIYTGVTPCADCEGIYTRLEFIDSVTYIKTSKYLGKSSRAFHDMGQWVIVNDSTVTLHSLGSTQQYLSDGQSLIMLDQQGKRIKGALAEYYKLMKGEPESTPNYAEKVNAGVDFVATGTEPFWNLDIDFDKELFFSNIDGDSLRAPIPAVTTEGTSTRVNINAGGTMLTVILTPTGCINAMSGAYSDYAVEVIYNQRSAVGCGQFISTLFSLHGSWKLSSLNGEAVADASYPNGLPELDFNVLTKTASGTTGCNKLTGSFTTNTSGALSFLPIATTRMFCTGVNETAFLKALQQTTAYRTEGDQLILSKGTSPLLTFVSN